MKIAKQAFRGYDISPEQIQGYKTMLINKTNKNLRCGNRKGLLSRNDQTHHRMGPKTMESIPPSKRNTQADIQLYLSASSSSRHPRYPRQLQQSHAPAKAYALLHERCKQLHEQDRVEVAARLMIHGESQPKEAPAAAPPLGGGSSYTRLNTGIQ